MSFIEDIQALVAKNAHGVLSCAPGWSRRPLGSVAAVINGYPFESKYFGNDSGKGDIPLVRIRNIVDGRSETSYSGPVPEGYWVENGDLLIGMDGDFNLSLWRGGRALLNQRVCKIVCDEREVRKRYLAHVLPGYLKLVNDFTSSVTVKHLSSRTLQQLPIPIPSLTIQDRILEKLDALLLEIEEGERALTEAREGLNTYRASLLNAAVTGKLTAEWRQKNPPTETGADLLCRILAKRDGKLRTTTRRTAGTRDTTAGETGELPELPASWCWARVGQIVDQTDYGTSVKCDRNTSGIPVIRMGNIQDGRLDLDDLKYAPRGSKDIPILERGDILFNRTNSAELLGKTAVYDGELAPCSFASYIVRLRLKKIEPRFFAAWLNSSYGRAWIALNKSQQVGQANLSAGKLMQMSVPVAPLAEQKAVVEKLEEALIAANGLRADNQTLATQCSALRQSVLSAAFRGELI
jgi:type I restriction enzyme S subunit